MCVSVDEAQFTGTTLLEPQPRLRNGDFLFPASTPTVREAWRGLLRPGGEVQGKKMFRDLTA